MADLTRRRFLQDTAACSLVTLSACATAAGVGSRRLRVAVAGVRVQGRRHLGMLLRSPGVELVGLADPDSVLLMQAAGLANRYEATPAITQDPREFLTRGDIDVLTIATPDHWHAWLAVRAFEAGMHVYVETPAAHSIEEGEAMVAAAAKHDRRMQVGLRARTHPAVQAAMEFVHAGGLGRIRSVRCVCYVNRLSIGRVEGSVEIPSHVDHDVWLGPSPQVPLTRRRLHGDWRYDWRTGTGELGEAGSELLDLARWALSGADEARWPDRMWTCGGRIGVRDDGQTPNTLVAVLDFGGIHVVFDQRNLPMNYDAGRRMDRFRGLRYGLVVDGTGRSLVIEPMRPSCMVYDDKRNLIRQFDGSGDPLVEFLAAVRGRGTLSADIEIGRGASDLAQLVAACHRTAAPVSRVEALRSTESDPNVIPEFDVFDTHIGRNGYDLDRETPNVSGWRAIDSATGEFRDNVAANALRRRTYRAPFLLARSGVVKSS